LHRTARLLLNDGRAADSGGSRPLIPE
jgi:hypothetical protein